eukprot:jgi/Botrbrau1/21339/Bobra.0184s0049.1
MQVANWSCRAESIPTPIWTCRLEEPSRAMISTAGRQRRWPGGPPCTSTLRCRRGVDLAAGWERYQQISKISVMDHSFHMAVTSWSDKVAHDMTQLVEEGVTSFKFFLAYKGVFQVSDDQFLHALSKAKELGALAMVHCENGDGVEMGQKTVFESGITGPEGHYLLPPLLP